MLAIICWCSCSTLWLYPQLLWLKSSLGGPFSCLLWLQSENCRNWMPSTKWLLLGWGCSNALAPRSPMGASAADTAALKSSGNRDHVQTPVRISELLDAEVRWLWPCQSWWRMWMLASCQNTVLNNLALSGDKDGPLALMMDSYHTFKYKCVPIATEI